MTEDKSTSVDLGDDDRLLWTDSMNVEDSDLPLFASRTLLSLLEDGYQKRHSHNKR